MVLDLSGRSTQRYKMTTALVTKDLKYHIYLGHSEIFLFAISCYVAFYSCALNFDDARQLNLLLIDIKPKVADSVRVPITIKQNFQLAGCGHTERKSI